MPFYNSHANKKYEPKLAYEQHADEALRKTKQVRSMIKNETNGNSNQRNMRPNFLIVFDVSKLKYYKS